MNGTVFKLEKPTLEQTHGRLMDRYQNFGPGTATVCFELGTLVGRKFVPEPRIVVPPKVLGTEALEKFYDYIQTQGQPREFRGQFRDGDLGAWFAGGNGF